jgi:CBS domain-containing protein
MESIAGEISKRAITVEVTNNMGNARDIMLEYNISRVIVVANTKPVGMVTEKAIESYLLKNVANPLDKIPISKAMRSPIITVTSDTSIETCAKLMIENKISSLAVIDNTQVNILTKSDLVKLYAENHRREHLIKDFMTKSVITISPLHSLRWALVLMIKNKISRLVVTREEDIVGIVTFRDLMPITNFVEGNTAIEPLDLPSIGCIILARDVMKKPIVLNVSDDLAEAAQVMHSKGISGIPAVHLNSHLSGIITKTDLVRALMDSK